MYVLYVCIYERMYVCVISYLFPVFSVVLQGEHDSSGGHGDDHPELQDHQHVQAQDGQDSRGRRAECGRPGQQGRQLRHDQDGGQARRPPGRDGAHPWNRY